MVGVQVVATDEDLAALVGDNSFFLITVGFIQSTQVRKKLFANLQQLGAQIATVVSTHALVSEHAQIGEGTVVMNGAQVNAAAIIGRNVIVNSKALIEHDAIVEDHCHVSCLL